MSTKATLSHNQDYHLYEEVLDNDNVYLRIDTTEWSYDGRGVTVQISIDNWRKMIEDWQASYWGKNPSKDHYVMTDEDWENSLSALEELMAIRKLNKGSQND